jgi:quercetin dioxygenase-like cupin family protein
MSAQCYSQHIPKLEEIVKKIWRNPLPHPMHIDLDVGGKVVRGTRLFGVKEVGIAVADIPAGVSFPRHNHNETEIFVVYEGELTIHHSEADHVLKATDILTVKPGVPHITRTGGTGCKCVVITIPGEEWFTNGTRPPWE